MPDDAFDATFDEMSSTLVLSGDLDQDITEALRDLLDTHIKGSRRSITVNLERVTYLPSSAIGVLVRSMAQAAQAGLELQLYAPEGTIAAVVLGVSGLPFRST